MARTALVDLNEREQLVRLQSVEKRLNARFTEFHSLLDVLASWRHLWWPQLEAQIWGSIPENARRRTIAKPDIMSVMDTVVAFMSSEKPKITVLPENPGRMSQSELANYSERVGWSLYDTINRNRAESILMQAAEEVFGTGHLVTKSIWLTHEDRGATFDLKPTGNRIFELNEDGEEVEVDETERVIIKEERFPLECEIIPTRDCMWEMNNRGEVIEFIYRYRATFSQLCDQFPGLEDMTQFKNHTDDTTKEMEVWDYWTPEVNAIVIDKKVLYKKATPHGMYCMPIVVEIVKSRDRRTNTHGVHREGTPFCYGMLQSIISLSWAASMMSTYLEQTIYFIVKHKGLKDNSPFWTRPETPEDDPQYKPIVKLGPGMQVVPLPEGEDWEIMQPPGINAPWLEYKQDRQRDASLVSFNEGILTGIMPAGPSGYSVFQQTIATKARMEPFRVGLERGLSRTMQTWFKIIATNYDYAEGQSMKLTRILENRRYGVREVELTAEDFKNIGMVMLKIDPKIRINNAEESQILMQAGMNGYASPYTVVDELGFVQDPEMELLRIEFFNFMRSPHPMAQQAQMGMAKKYADLQGLDIPWPSSQPVDPNTGLAGAAGAQPDLAALLGQATDPSQFAVQASTGGVAGTEEQSAAMLEQLMAQGPPQPNGNGVVR